MKRKIFFRADAGAQIGYGHFTRTLALAEMLKDNFNCTYYTSEPTEYQIGEMSKVCHHIALNEETKFEDFLEYLSGDEVVVLDNYFFGTDYQLAIKSKGSKLVCIDDLHDKHYVADIVINQSATDESIFSVESYTRLLLGPDYLLLRAPFLLPPARIKRNNDMVICLGGADPCHITDKIVSCLLKMNVPYNIVCILGDKVFISEDNKVKVEIRRNLSSAEMAEVFDRSACALVSASMVSIEALSRGVPLIAGYYVDNQEEHYNRLVSEGLAAGVGFWPEVSESDIINALTGIRKLQPCHMVTSGIAKRYQSIFASLCSE